MLRFFDHAGISSNILARAWWKCVICIKSLLLANELTGLVFFANFLNRCCECLVQLLLVVFAGTRSIVSSQVIDNIWSFLGLKGSWTRNGKSTVVQFSNDLRPVLSRSKARANWLLLETRDSWAKDRDTCWSGLGTHEIAEGRAHSLISTRSRAGFASLHFTFILWLMITIIFKVVLDSALVITNFDGFHTVTIEKWLIWFVELPLNGVWTWTNRSSSILKRFDEFTRAGAARSVPRDSCSGLLPGLLFYEKVCARSYSTRVIHQSTHLTDFLIVVVLSIGINYGCQKARRNTRNWHLLKTGVADSCRSSSWRNSLDDGYRIDNSAWASLLGTKSPCETYWSWCIVRTVVSRPRVNSRLLVHLNLCHIRFDSWILLHSHVDMTIILCEEFIFRAHAGQRCLLFENTDLALVSSGS